MKTLKTISLSMFLGLTLIAPSAFAEAKKQDLNLKTSALNWKGTKVVGSSHVGTLMFKSGSVNTVSGKLTNGTFVVDMASIKNEDVEDAKWNTKLVNHLKSDDFFGVANHPTSKLVIKKFQHIKDGLYQARGELTIKGITKPVSFKAETKSGSGDIQTLKATLLFDRTDFNVRYGSGKFFDNLGDKMISDEIKVEANITFKNGIKTAKK